MAPRYQKGNGSGSSVCDFLYSKNTKEKRSKFCSWTFKKGYNHMGSGYTNELCSGYTNDPKDKSNGGCNNAKFMQLWALHGKEFCNTCGKFKINEGQATLNEVTNKGINISCSNIPDMKQANDYLTNSGFCKAPGAQHLDDDINNLKSS